MEQAKAIHTILVEMTTGMLVLATVAIVILAWITYFGGGRYRRLGEAADSVALFGTAIGTPMILLAILSGFRQWPLEAFLNSVIARNKIFTAIVALGFWAAFLLLRLASGKRLWERRGLTLYALILGVGGFAYLVFTASIGGDLARKPSGFETLVRAVVETRRTFVLPDVANALLVVAGVVIPLAVLFWSRRKSLR